MELEKKMKQELSDQELEQTAGGEWMEMSGGFGVRVIYTCPLCGFKTGCVPRMVYSASPEEMHQKRSPGCKGVLQRATVSSRDRPFY